LITGVHQQLIRAFRRPDENPRIAVFKPFRVDASSPSLPGEAQRHSLDRVVDAEFFVPVQQGTQDFPEPFGRRHQRDHPVGIRFDKG
jgi:hypothetical protein